MEEKKPNWNGLNESKCPLCDSLLFDLSEKGLVKCTNHDCTFKIRETRLNEILMSQQGFRKAFYQPNNEDDNLSNLNNL